MLRFGLSMSSLRFTPICITTNASNASMGGPILRELLLPTLSMLCYYGCS
jgi:hypothetical protein